jgi:allantoin racemase
MKIWYQSASSLRYEPVWDNYGLALEEQCKKILRPDTEVFITGIPVMARDIEMHKSLQYFQNVQILNNMVQAQREGYDAIILGCTLDPGLAEGKAMLDIPVVGISEVNYHLATMYGNRFAIVTTSPALWENYCMQIERYGINPNRYMPGPYIFEVSEEDIARSLTNPAPIVDKFMAVAEKAVADGASVIIPSPGFLATLLNKAGINRVNDASIFDTISVALKSAEALADLHKIGISPSRRPGVYAKPSDKYAATTMKKFEQIFKIRF